MKILDKVDKSQPIIILIILILIFLLLITPIIQISQYNTPSADDYTYGENTHKVWEGTHNVLLVITEAFNEIRNTYINWQGTFSAIFLFSLQPAIFGLEFYKITTIILLVFFIFSNIFLIKTISKVLFHYNKNILPYIISLVLITFSLQFVPSPRESFFWWNGASFYTLFYCVMLITISLLIRLIKSTNKKNIIINTISCLLLTFILGGGNYCTALQYILILSILTVLCFITHNTNKWNMFAIMILGLFSFFISIMAPGNAIRQARFTNRIGPFQSILKSLELGIIWCRYWTNGKSIIMFLILIIPIYQIIKTTTFKFKYPIIFTIITFGIYASQQVPTIYAMNYFGPSRAINIYYYSYYLLVISNIVYYLGWLKKKKNDIKCLDFLNENILPYTLIMILVLIIYMQPYYKTSLTYNAYKSIETGEAKAYKEQIMERYKIYEDESITDAVVKPLTVKPFILCSSDLQYDESDIDYWINEGIAKYFNKNSVNLEKNIE